MDAELVRSWIATAEADLKTLAEEAEQVQARLAESRRKLALLHELLASVTSGSVAIAHGAELSTRERVERDAETILREFGRPLRIQEIHAEFVRRGIPVPGRGTSTNIVAHLIGSRRITRVSRGIYALAEWEGAQRVPNTDVKVGVR